VIQINEYNPYLSLYKVTYTFDDLIKKFLGYNKIYACSSNSKLREEAKQYIYSNIFVEMSANQLTRKFLIEYFREKGSMELLREFLIFYGIVERVLLSEKEKYIQSQVAGLVR